MSDKFVGATALPNPKDFKAPVFGDNKLVLYFHPYNLSCQKVLFVLYEKNIEFTPYVIDLTSHEQYSDWFLSLNPQGNVPVLQNGAFIIPNSSRIINYLEVHFREPQHPRMKPASIESTQFDQIMIYESAISRLPIAALSLGSFIHDDLKLMPKAPFIDPVRKACINNNEREMQILKYFVDNQAKNKETFQHKLQIREQRRDLIYNRDEFQRVLDAVGKVLAYVEQELSKQIPRTKWLTGDDLTIADISLGLLLHRLYQLGFENFYWGYGKLPQVEDFFLRFKKLPSYQKLMPSNFEILKDMWTKTPGNYKLTTGAGVLGMAMFSALGQN